jgi:hypothetical protein
MRGGKRGVMKSSKIFERACQAVNFLFLASFLFFIVAVCWEYSTRRYLRGFSDAIVPVSASPIEKAESILNWMEHGPARYATPSHGTDNIRDPEETLNYASRLRHGHQRLREPRQCRRIARAAPFAHER